MASNQMLIPTKIKVGFQNREDTYSKKLAYVIFYDHKNVLRKEKSWQSWRDEKIKPEDFDNEPTEGFVLNKKVGGYKSHYNFRDSHVRVYDPRGFEFEISVSNLLFILQQCDCNRGKGLEGKFVYAWQGTELVLLPVDSEEYKQSTQFTQLQTRTVKAKDLIPGASYSTKKQDIYTYLGKFVKYNVNISSEKKKKESKFVFWDAKSKTFVFFSDIKSIAECASDVISPDYAKLVVKYNKSVWGSKPVKLFTKTKKRKANNEYENYNWTIEESEGVYMQCCSLYESRFDLKLMKHINDPEPNGIVGRCKISIQNDFLHSENVNRYFYKDPQQMQRQQSRYWDRYETRFFDKWIEPTDQELWVELESGAKFQLNYSNFMI